MAREGGSYEMKDGKAVKVSGTQAADKESPTLKPSETDSKDKTSKASK